MHNIMVVFTQKDPTFCSLVQLAKVNKQNILLFATEIDNFWKWLSFPFH